MYNKLYRLCDVSVSVQCRKSWVQIKNYKTDLCSFIAKHATLVSNSKHWLLRIMYPIRATDISFILLTVVLVS